MAQALATLRFCGWGSLGHRPAIHNDVSFFMRFEICLPGTLFREKGPSVGGLLPKMVQALATKHWWLEKPRALPRHV